MNLAVLTGAPRDRDETAPATDTRARFGTDAAPAEKLDELRREIAG